MNIIFGKKEVEQLEEKYIVLELDTITIRSSNPITVYCVVETIPLEQFPKLEPLKKLHSELMIKYRTRNWNFCEQAIEQLMGCWGKDVDSFYDILLTRIQEFKENEPDSDWTGIIAK